MKKIGLLLLFVFLGTTLVYSQGFVEKSKSKKEVVTAPIETADTTTQEIVPVVTTFISKTKSRTENNFQVDQSNQPEVIKTELKMRDFYPVSQIEAYLSYVSLKNSVFKVNGGSFYAVVRQKYDLSKATRNVKIWGLYAEGGKYEIDITEKNQEPVKISVNQIGGGLSFAMSRNRPGFNTVVLNLGVIQEVENGSSGLFDWRQTDLILSHTGWLDLSRNKNLFFSRTNLSWFWKKPISSRRSSLYNGATAKSEIWEKETAGAEFQQTVIMFYVSEGFGIHAGIKIAYQHLSGNMQDWYAPGVFLELHNKDYKIGQLSFGKNIRSGGSDVRDSYDEIKASIDLYQLAKSFF